MKHLLFFLIIAAVMASCDEKKLEPITPSLGQPGIPTDVKTEAIAGGVIITYRIPDAEDILGVKAVYSLADGKERETLSSFYTNQIRIEGYDDEKEHKVTLYAVNRAMVQSEPVEVTFVPMESAISKVAKSLTIERDFGGALYSWKNEDRASMTIEMLTTDSLGAMVAMNIMTTASKEGSYALRGYDTKPRWFAALVRDNFSNVSDTIYPLNREGNRLQLEPMYEQKLDKSDITFLPLSNDVEFNAFGGNNQYMIDDDLNSFGHSDNGTLPASVTMDLGMYCKLSRVVINQRNNDFYGWGNPKTFEVYTTDGVPDNSGDWSQWNKILDCEVIKPSGQPSGTLTDEDREAAEEGHDFSFSLNQEPVRYVRFRFTEVWTSSTFCHVAEITFYGDPNVEQ